ncbi:MAG: UDP-glucose 6-dehydrogenase, partial [Bacteroidaceae bacterium]|nr:UDP-glucose 6-dehydrogenase [Bacteroidaceae bacterium]
DIYDAVEGADALLVPTEWMQFRMPDWRKVKERMKGSLIIDGRNIYMPEEMHRMGFDYTSIGRP